jgi:hypothetical protein
MRYVVLLAVVLAGCSATQPRAEPIGNGRYTITAESTSQASNAAAVARRLAIKKATKYCAKKDRGLNWETFEDGTTDHSYTTKLTFSCR